MDFMDGQPSAHGLFIRSVEGDLTGEVTDMDMEDGHHRVQVKFPHERVDTYKTTFGPDCFRDSFAERKPVMCWQHDLRDPIGLSTSAQVLRQHNELIGRFSKFDEERGLIPVPNAYRAYCQLRDGEITDFSFGFREPKYESHPQFRGVRRIKWAIMKEFSPVTIGSIPGAVATGVREEDVMAELGVKEILELRNAGLISDPDAQQALKQLGGPLEHITIGKVRDDGTPEPKPIEGKLMPDGSFQAADGSTLSAEDLSIGAGARGDAAVELPPVLNAATILDALPESYQRALAENEARVFLVVGDDEWGPITERSMDDKAVELVAQADLACRHGVEWLSDVDMDTLPEEVRQAAALFQAAGTANAAALEIADPDGEIRAAAEDMAPEPVKCELCGGTGRVDDAGSEDGKVCPRCGGTGVEAVERSEEDDEVRVPYWEEPMYVRFVSVDDRKKMADKGVAMPNGDFPIPDKGHLASALGHWSTYQGDKAAAKAHIKKRAKALGVTLADDDFTANRAIPDDAPEGSKACAKCHGDGKLPAPKAGGHRLTCPDCHGKGWMSPSDQASTRAKPDDDNDSEDDMADESGDGKPSGTGAAADEDVEPDEDDEETERMRQEALDMLGKRVGTAA